MASDPTETPVGTASKTQIREALQNARAIVARCKVIAGKQVILVDKCDASLKEIDAVLTALDRRAAAAP